MRDCLARGVALALTLAACFGCGGGVEVRRVETIPASWSVEEVDVRRGEVRVAGAVAVDDRAANLDIVEPCTTRALGRGVWTRNRLVWWLTTDDIAAALGCKGSSLGVLAREKATMLAPAHFDGAGAGAAAAGAISERLSVRLALADETSAGIDSLSLVQEGSETLVEARAEGARGAGGLRLAMLGGVTGPAWISEDDATARFRVPTASLVAAALRRGSLRVFVGTGEREASARLVVFIESHEAAVPEPEPESRGESGSDD